MIIDWTTRPDHRDAAAVRVVNEWAFPVSREAGISQALWTDLAAWTPGPSHSTATAGGA